MSTIETEPTGAPRSGGAVGSGAVLEIEDLHVTFKTEDGPVHAVRGVDLAVHEGETLGIVGESGSGKSVTMLAIMGLLPRTATITGSVKFRGRSCSGCEQKDVRPLPRVEDRDDLPGSAHRAEPGATRSATRSSRRSTAHQRRLRRTQAQAPRDRAARSRRHPAPGHARSISIRTSSRAACASGR